MKNCEISPRLALNLLKELGSSPLHIEGLMNSSSDICQYLADALNVKCLKGWKFNSLLGKGVHGVVFSISKKGTRTERAVKIVSRNPYSEIKTQKLIASKGGAPKIVETCKFAKDKWIIISEKVEGTVDALTENKLSKVKLDRIYSEITRLIGVMEKCNMSHGDLRLENIGYVHRKDGKIVLKILDFGESKRYIPMFDISYFAIDLLWITNQKNRQYLFDKTTRYIQERHLIILPESTNTMTNIIMQAAVDIEKFHNQKPK